MLLLTQQALGYFPAFFPYALLLFFSLTLDHSNVE